MGVFNVAWRRVTPTVSFLRSTILLLLPIVLIAKHLNSKHAFQRRLLIKTIKPTGAVYFILSDCEVISWSPSKKLKWFFLRLLRKLRSVGDSHVDFVSVKWISIVTTEMAEKYHSLQSTPFLFLRVWLIRVGTVQ